MSREDDPLPPKRRTLARAESAVTSDSGMSSGSAQEISTESPSVVARGQSDWPPASTCAICLCEEEIDMDGHLMTAHPNDVFVFTSGQVRAFVHVQAAIAESIRRYSQTGDQAAASFSYPSDKRRCGYQCVGCDHHYYRQEILATHKKQCKASFRLYCRFCDIYFKNEMSYAEHVKCINKERRVSSGYLICTPPESAHSRIATLVELELALRAKRNIRPGTGYDASWWTEAETSPDDSTPFNVYTFNGAEGTSGEGKRSEAGKFNQVQVRSDLMAASNVQMQFCDRVVWHHPQGHITAKVIPVDMALPDRTVTMTSLGITTTTVTSATLRDPRQEVRPSPPLKTAVSKICTWSPRLVPNMNIPNNGPNQLRLFPFDMNHVLRYSSTNPYLGVQDITA